jgi:hypothetical protein
LNNEGGAYRKFQRDFDQWYAAMGVAGREEFGWPVGDHLTAAAVELQKRARTHIDELRDLGAQKETVAECKKRDEVLTFVLDENNRAKNMQMVREEINQRYQQINVRIQNQDNRVRTDFNTHNVTKSVTQGVYMTETQGRKRTAVEANLPLESGTNSAPTTEVAVGGEPFAKQRRIDGPGEIQTITHDAGFTQTPVTFDDEGGNTARTEAAALPGKGPPPPKEVAAPTETRIPPTTIGTKPTMNTVPKPEPVDPRDANPPPKEASQQGQPAARPKRKRDFKEGGDTNESQLEQKEKRQKPAAARAQFASAPEKGAKPRKSTFTGTAEGDLTGIDGFFDKKMQALLTEFKTQTTLKEAGRVYYEIFEFVPLGDEETGYYTNLSTKKRGNLARGPNTMFQKLKARRHGGGGIPEDQREVAGIVQASPEYKLWLDIVRYAKTRIEDSQKSMTRVPNTLQPKAYYKKLS